MGACFCILRIECLLVLSVSLFKAFRNLFNSSTPPYSEKNRLNKTAQLSVWAQPTILTSLAVYHNVFEKKYEHYAESLPQLTCIKVHNDKNKC